ncbi:MAG: hypothetical protein IJ716_14485 [Lachnospiraceae bacterium]|nr:hypothetical protein [Lachnospiraceae bacterium]
MAKDYFPMDAVDAMSYSLNCLGYDEFGRAVAFRSHATQPPVRTAKIFLDNGIGYEVDLYKISRKQLSPYCPIVIDVKGKLTKIFGGVQDCIPSSNGMPYEKIIFNDPATIVIWKDGTKTIVKCQPGEVYDKEKGVALCFMKKALGNKGNFNNVFRDCGALEETPKIDIFFKAPVTKVVEEITENVRRYEDGNN